jgi:trk system potassium uptake protein TrkA
MHILIIGGGKVGGYLAELLTAAGHEVTIIEIRRDHALQLRRTHPGANIIIGDGADPALLEAAGARRAQAVAAVTGADEANLVITSLAKLELGVPRSVARVNDPRNAWLYTPEMGVDQVLNQADVVAHLIMNEMKLP